MQQTDPWRIARRTAPRAAALPRIILYAVGPAIFAQCRAAAKEGTLTLVEVKHLQAACVELETGPAARLVLSRALKWWDRAVVEEHAARAAVPITLVSDDDGAEIARDMLTWVVDAARRRRPGTTGISPRPSRPRRPR